MEVIYWAVGDGTICRAGARRSQEILDICYATLPLDTFYLKAEVNHFFRMQNASPMSRKTIELGSGTGVDML